MFKSNTVFTGVWWKTVTIRQNIFCQIFWRVSNRQNFPPLKICTIQHIKAYCVSLDNSCDTFFKFLWWLLYVAMCAFEHFYQVIMTQQNRIAGTISHSFHFIQVQYQLMNPPLSYGHDIKFNVHTNRQTDRCGILFNLNIINCTN